MAQLALYGIAIAERGVGSLCRQFVGEETKPYSAPITEKSTGDGRKRLKKSPNLCACNQLQGTKP